MDREEAIDALMRQREEVQAQIIALNDDGDPERVRTSTLACGLQAKFWRIQTQVYLFDDEHKLAEVAARRAVDFEKQVAHSAKCEIADRVHDLEERAKELGGAAGQLSGLRIVGE